MSKRRQYPIQACVKILNIHTKVLCDEVESRQDSVIVYRGDESIEHPNTTIVWARPNPLYTK